MTPPQVQSKLISHLQPPGPRVQQSLPALAHQQEAPLLLRCDLPTISPHLARPRLIPHHVPPPSHPADLPRSLPISPALPGTRADLENEMLRIRVLDYDVRSPRDLPAIRPSSLFISFISTPPRLPCAAALRDLSAIRPQVGSRNDVMGFAEVPMRGVLQARCPAASHHIPPPWPTHSHHAAPRLTTGRSASRLLPSAPATSRSARPARPVRLPLLPLPPHLTLAQGGRMSAPLAMWEDPANKKFSKHTSGWTVPPPCVRTAPPRYHQKAWGAHPGAPPP